MNPYVLFWASMPVAWLALNHGAWITALASIGLIVYAATRMPPFGLLLTSVAAALAIGSLALLGPGARGDTSLLAFVSMALMVYAHYRLSRQHHARNGP